MGKQSPWQFSHKNNLYHGSYTEGVCVCMISSEDLRWIILF